MFQFDSFEPVHLIDMDGMDYSEEGMYYYLLNTDNSAFFTF